MQWLWTLFGIILLSSACYSSSDYLYLYGEPYNTLSTGFSRIDPKDFSSHATAKGFATDTDLNLVAGLNLNEEGTQGILFGNFQFWNRTYVGSILQINPATLNVSTIGSGVLGQAITCLDFISDTQIAIGGEFTGFTEDPIPQLTQIGICNNKGQNCYTLSSVPIDSGPKNLFYLNGYLYASFLPDVVPPSIEIWRYNFLSENPNQEWVEILNQQADVRSVMTIYNGSIWLFGSMTIQEITYGAMQYEPSSNSWAAYNPNPGYNLTNTELGVLVSVSPDTQTAYLTVVSDSFSIYKWNNQANSWINWTALTCPSHTTALSFAAFGSGLIVPCNGTLVKLSEQNISDIGIMVVQQPIGNFFCKNSLLETMPNQNTVIAFCQTEIGRFATYEISTATQQQCCGYLSDLSQLVLPLDAMCVYGPKIFLSGSFQEVDLVPSDYSMSIWNEDYESWSSIDLPANTSVVNCYCDTDGSMMAALCRTSGSENNYPFLIIDYATTVPNGFTIAMLTDTQGYDKISAIQIYDSQIFFAAGSTQEDSVGIFSWSQIFGSVPELVVDGAFISSMLFVDDLLFMAGTLSVVGNETVSLAAYNTSTNEFVPMDPLLKTASVRGRAISLSYNTYTNLLYVSGDFSQAGSLHVQNVVGYSINGTAVDNLGGGLPNGVTSLVSINDGMFAVFLQDCPESLDVNCAAVVYFDFKTQSWSYPIVFGAGFITQGADIGGDDDSSDDWEYIEKIIISSGVLIGVAVIALLAIFIIKRRQSQSSRLYREIPNPIASLEDPEFASVADTIDFVHDQFEPKEVLGKGSFGTVWTCVFPQTAPAATFAVKQILLSKGDVKKIEAVEQEIEILEKLRHPHLVRFLGSRKEISVTSVEFFLFMELYESPSSLKGVILKKLQKAEESGNYEWFSYAEVAKFMKQISDGLCYLHQQGISHRDLKCSNILIQLDSNSTSVKSLHISDYGIAKPIEEGSNKLASAMVTASAFMAPEIFQHESYDAFKADIWSIGMVLYEILTWEEPTTPGFRPDFPEHHPLAQSTENQFDQIVEIFKECTEPDPSKRPTCEELYHMCSTL